MYNIPPPSDWKKFEALCKDLWEKILSDPQIQLHGRGGQNQNGVDIFGVNAKDSKNYGIQCKQKNSPNELKFDEVKREIEKAKEFLPKLDVYIIATTAPKNQRIETHVSQINEQHKKNGDFLVYVYGWGDIEAKLNNHIDILIKYYTEFIHPQSNNLEYLNFWYAEAKIDNLWYYACHLPFSQYNVDYSYIHINMLMGYLNKHDAFLNNANEKLVDPKIKNLLGIFNEKVNKLIAAIQDQQPQECKTTRNDIIYTYRVNCDNIPYHERGNFIENKKNELRICFYDLIRVANGIILLWNELLPLGVKKTSLIEFSQPNPNYPLLGEIYLISPHYPLSQVC